jgi:hypothetical protein
VVYFVYLYSFCLVFLSLCCSCIRHLCCSACANWIAFNWTKISVDMKSQRSPKLRTISYQCPLRGVRRRGGIIFGTGKNKILWEKSYLNITLYTTNPTRTTLRKTRPPLRNDGNYSRNSPCLWLEWFWRLRFVQKGSTNIQLYRSVQNGSTNL